MKYNKKLLLILGLAAILALTAILLTGSIFNFISSDENPSDDTDTSMNEGKPTDNEQNDNNISKPSTGTENEDPKDEDSKDEEPKDDTQDDENTNTDQPPNSTDSPLPDKDETGTDKPNGNMEINKEGIYAVDNNYFKSIYPLDEKSVLKAADYLNNLQKTYLTENNKVFYAVIPDKTYYDKASGYDKPDHDKMIGTLNENITDMEYIELKDLLSLNDYYKADNHWRQESIIDVANKIGEKLGFKINADNFEEKSYTGFKGMYSKYITNQTTAEDIKYLTNDHIANATVDNYQHKDFTSVYDTNRLSTDISYDVFLSGATPFLTITNSSADNEKELVIFRDSFASSLAPLLVSEYSKITLIDTRYMASVLIKDFIEFDDQDVLFLYSSAVINNSSMLK